MTVRLPEKIDDPKIEEKPAEGETLPPTEPEIVETPEAPAEPSAEERANKLEIELAEARGRLAGIKETTVSPVVDTVSQQERQFYTAKSSMLADANGLEDEDFKRKYGGSKDSIRFQFSDYERQMSEQRSAEKLAKIEAENELLTKHGPVYAKHKSEIAKALDEASPEVKKDPVRLAKFMERAFYALSRDEKPEPAARKENTTVKRPITNDFSAPQPSQRTAQRKAEEDDQLTGEELEVGRHFGITTKSEREKYSGKYLEMKFGNGLVLRDPRKGIEKITTK